MYPNGARLSVLDMRKMKRMIYWFLPVANLGLKCYNIVKYSFKDAKKVQNKQIIAKVANLNLVKMTSYGFERI